MLVEWVSGLDSWEPPLMSRLISLVQLFIIDLISTGRIEIICYLFFGNFSAYFFPEDLSASMQTCELYFF
jgi:hypothetical protein